MSRSEDRPYFVTPSPHGRRRRAVVARQFAKFKFRADFCSANLHDVQPVKGVASVRAVVLRMKGGHGRRLAAAAGMLHHAVTVVHANTHAV
eukprot:365028-Chlamydomonas_euryale.AAC.31